MRQIDSSAWGELAPILSAAVDYADDAGGRVISVRADPYTLPAVQLSADGADGMTTAEVMAAIGGSWEATRVDIGVDDTVHLSTTLVGVRFMIVTDDPEIIDAYITTSEPIAWGDR